MRLNFFLTLSKDKFLICFFPKDGNDLKMGLLQGAEDETTDFDLGLRVGGLNYPTIKALVKSFEIACYCFSRYDSIVPLEKGSFELSYKDRLTVLIFTLIHAFPFTRRRLFEIGTINSVQKQKKIFGDEKFNSFVTLEPQASGQDKICSDPNSFIAFPKVTLTPLGLLFVGTQLGIEETAQEAVVNGFLRAYGSVVYQILFRYGSFYSGQDFNLNATRRMLPPTEKQVEKSQGKVGRKKADLTFDFAKARVKRKDIMDDGKKES